MSIRELTCIGCPMGCQLTAVLEDGQVTRVTGNTCPRGDAYARRVNVLGAYEAVHPERIAGKRFLLVDDICTTGSTLGEAARVLRQAGAADVLGLTLAVTREE